MKPLHLFDRLDHLEVSIRTAERVLVFTDFDGTLVPIRDRPEECFLDPDVARLLSSLAENDRAAVGIISGRELGDLRHRVGVDGLAYAGNHGLQIEGPGFSFLEPTAADLMSDLPGIVNNLQGALVEYSGAWLEDKGLSASVHFRQMHSENVPKLLETVRTVTASAVAAGKIILRGGNMVLELRPAVPWNKGDAVGWLADKFSSNCTNPFLIYLGDDETDEDVFGIWKDNLTVHVGGTSATEAHYFLHDPQAVHAFLHWLRNTLRSTSNVSHLADDPDGSLHNASPEQIDR